MPSETLMASKARIRQLSLGVIDLDYVRRIRAIVDRLDSPYAHQVYVAKDYTKADLIRDLSALVYDAALHA